MHKFVHEVLHEVGKQREKAQKIRILKENETWALKDVIRGSMDSTVKWYLPMGEVPYTPAEPHNAPSNLLRENKKFTYFAKGGKGDQLPQFKRERLVLGMLESIHPEDSKFLVDMINKKTPKGLTKNIVQEAFPGLLKD